ncbi:MAG: peroxiredoxin [Nitrososphaerota archaeon]|nr:peroxiredoxin [Nitrososphaerota archaeon]
MPGEIPLIGEKLPTMKVSTTVGQKTIPDDYAGKWLVLFSHPGDFTPVCTTEFYSFARRFDDFKNLNAELLGLSVDTVPSHIQWITWIKEKLGMEIPFPIIADPMGAVSKQLGMIQAQSATNTVRAVFIINPQGVIRTIIYYPLELGRNMDEILRALKGLQVIEREKVALPANWPNSEVVGENAIVPTALTVQDAAERLKQYKGFDWWLAYKPVPKEDVETASKYLERVSKKPTPLSK